MTTSAGVRVKNLGGTPISRLRLAVCLFLCLYLVPPGTVAAQEPLPVTREAAVEAALTRGPLLGVARADTALAAAQLRAAGALPNPALSASYSKSTPRYHLLLDVPLDYFWLRGNRVGAAKAARASSQYRFQFDRASVAFDADTTYTVAVAAHGRALISRQNAVTADSLRRMAELRRDAGDASDLDVELATLNAGQQANAAAVDSLAFDSALLDLQVAMGIPADRVSVKVEDSLPLPARVNDPPRTGTPLPVASAEASLRSAELATRAQRRSLFSPFSITAGIETGDPSGSEPGVLPTVGLSIPLPLFSQSHGPIAQAKAEQERARAELVLARVQAAARLARAVRENDLARAKVERGQRLLEAADRVARMSLTAYHEGAVPLVSVLEAQRNAREVRAQVVSDLAQAWIASAALRLFTLSASPEPAR
jgi:outer membrane protein, heavy metal efflux system